MWTPFIDLGHSYFSDKIVVACRAAVSKMDFTLSAPVPSIIWSSLEDVLSTNMRLFAKDIAKTLGQPEGPLLKALNAQTIRPHLLEAEGHEIDACCGVICVKPETPYFLQPCGQPIVWTSTTRRCMEHLAYKAPIVPSSLPVLRRLEYAEKALYVSEDHTVYSEDYTAVGQFVDGVLRLFSSE